MPRRSLRTTNPKVSAIAIGSFASAKRRARVVPSDFAGVGGVADAHAFDALGRDLSFLLVLPGARGFGGLKEEVLVDLRGQLVDAVGGVSLGFARFRSLHLGIALLRERHPIAKGQGSQPPP